MEAWAPIAVAAVTGVMSGGLIGVWIKARPEANKMNVESAQITVQMGQSVLKDVYEALEHTQSELEGMRHELAMLRNENARLRDENRKLHMNNVRLEEKMLRATIRGPRRSGDPETYQRLKEEEGGDNDQATAE